MLRDTSSLLAQLLPAIVNHLTPEGKIPESGNLREQGLNILEGLTESRIIW